MAPISGLALPPTWALQAPNWGANFSFSPPSAPSECGVLLVLSLPASTLPVALHSHATCLSPRSTDTPLGAILYLSLGLWACVGLQRGSLHIFSASDHRDHPATLCKR